MALVVSLAMIAAAPMAVADSYSVVENTVSESGGQGVEGAWVFRLGVLVAAIAVMALAHLARPVWGRHATWLFRLYAVALFFATVFPEAPWDGGPHDETVAFLHTASAFSACMGFILGVVTVSTTRPRDDLARRVSDWITAATVVVVPLIMMVAERDGLMQRLAVLVGYLWLLIETGRVGRLSRSSIPPEVHRIKRWI